MSFTKRYPKEVQEQLAAIRKESGVKLVPSPSNKMARAQRDGKTVAYVCPGKRGVRIVRREPLPVKQRPAGAHVLKKGHISFTARVGDDAATKKSLALLA